MKKFIGKGVCLNCLSGGPEGVSPCCDCNIPHAGKKVMDRLRIIYEKTVNPAAAEDSCE